MQTDVAESTNEQKALLFAQIKNALKGDGKFTYFDEISYQIHDNSRSISKTDFYDKSYKYKDEDESIRMSFVLCSVHELGHANKQQLLSWLKMKKKLYPRKLIPAAGTDAANNERILTNMLTNLCKNGLLVAHDYVTQDKHVIVIYTCTYYGHIFYRNHLEIHSIFDTNSMFRTHIDSFKRLASNSVACALAAHPDCTAVSVNGRYGQHPKKAEVDGFAYGIAEFFGGTERAQVFLIEPVFYRFNPKNMTEEELEMKNIERLRLAERIKKSVADEYKCPVRMIFVIENAQGLKRLALFAKDNNSDMFTDALYTSENIFYNMKNDLDSCFVIPSFTESGQLKLSPVRGEWIR